MIKYERAPDIAEIAKNVVDKLGMSYIDISRVWFMRSFGSKSRYTLARIHVLPRIMQRALGIPAQYVVEIITEKYNKLSEEEQIKTIIHELMHIPKSFGGGFRHHKPYVTRRTVELMFNQYKNL
ncbi:MAG: metallopeptidase [Candidatus Aenigmarchaeota archaeon]|nr:metallopeptidase [Candidatus Aenigmarchaeota archaeon]